MPTAAVNGVRLHYEIFGSGRDVVLCHGYAGSHQDWIQPISALMSDYRLVVKDRRGHGSSQSPANADAYSIKVFADDVRGLMALAGVTKCCLGGHSMGGFIALELALSHPEMVAALVLVDTSSGQMDMPSEHGEARLKALDIARTQGTTAAFDYVSANSPMVRNHLQKNPHMRAISRQRTAETSVEGYTHGWGAIRNWAPITHRLPEIEVPTLIVVGEEDAPFLRPAEVLRNGIINSRIAVIPGSGHTPHLEQPEAFNRELRGFLAQHFPPSG
ncbi:MAG: alpha/beta hydrolase [Dehalococcoidia bacterium]|nr:alpha/beta hydrolase [Dehalococcoidia bacterium]